MGVTKGNECCQNQGSKNNIVCKHCLLFTCLLFAKKTQFVVRPRKVSSLFVSSTNNENVRILVLFVALRPLAKINFI